MKRSASSSGSIGSHGHTNRGNKCYLAMYALFAVLAIIVLMQQSLLHILPNPSDSIADSKYLRNNINTRSFKEIRPYVDKNIPIANDIMEKLPTKIPMSHVINKIHTIIDKPHQQTKVAILVPYMGTSLPAWFDTFLFTAQFSSQHYEWLIFVDKAPLKPLPKNVKLIRLTPQEFYRRLSTLDDNPPPELVGVMPQRLQTLLELQERA